MAYPRLTARNFGDGLAFVTLLPAPRQVSPSPFGLMQPVDLDHAHDERFWQLYRFHSCLSPRRNPLAETS